MGLALAVTMAATSLNAWRCFKHSILEPEKV
jgi:hypothetical protein